MPLTKHTESKLKKFKKEELISHIISLYDKISEGEAGSVPYYEHKELIEKYDKLKANADELVAKIQKGLKEEKESLAETEKEGLAMLETNEQLLKSNEEGLQHLKALAEENEKLKKAIDYLNTSEAWCEELQELKKENEELKAEKDLRDKHYGCINEEIVEAEKLMSIFGWKPVEEAISCVGCRLKRFHNFAIQLIRDNKKMQTQLVALCDPESVAATAE